MLTLGREAIQFVSEEFCTNALTRLTTLAATKTSLSNIHRW